MAKIIPGKVIRDSFTMPLADYALIGALKQRCIGLGIAMKKSELLRAGLAALDRLPDESLFQVVTALESVKTGRPPGKKKRKKKRKRKRSEREAGSNDWNMFGATHMTRNAATAAAAIESGRRAMFGSQVVLDLYECETAHLDDLAWVKERS